MDEFKELSLLLGPLTLPLETGEILLAGGGDDDDGRPPTGARS